MAQADRSRSNRTIWAIAFLGIAVIVTVSLAIGGQRFYSGSEENDGRRPTGYPQLVSVQPLPEMPEGEMCALQPAQLAQPAGSPALLAAALMQEKSSAQPASAPAADKRSAVILNRPPERVIRDPYPTYSAVAIDPKNNEIVLQDENLFQLMVYDRMTNTPSTANLSEPKRVISGHDTNVEFNCAIYIDPKTGDLYSVNNDTLDTMTVFSRNQKGNVRPRPGIKHSAQNLWNRGR